MPSHSEKQRRLFGMARAIQKGDMPLDKSPQAARIARTVEPEKVKHFASEVESLAQGVVDMLLDSEKPPTYYKKGSRFRVHYWEPSGIKEEPFDTEEQAYDELLNNRKKHGGHRSVVVHNAVVENGPDLEGMKSDLAMAFQRIGKMVEPEDFYQMSERDITLLHALYVEGRTAGEVGRRYSVSAGMVKYHCNKALRKLRASADVNDQRDGFPPGDFKTAYERGSKLCPVTRPHDYVDYQGLRR